MPDKRYPMLWQRGLIQARVRAKANHTCEGCGMVFQEGTNKSVNLYEDSNGKMRHMIGTVHHIDEDKQNCSMSNLVFLCQSCHFSIHAKNWKGVPQKWMIERNVPYKGVAPNQLPLFDLTVRK